MPVITQAQQQIPQQVTPYAQATPEQMPRAPYTW
jgi:hypothetical protein